MEINLFTQFNFIMYITDRYPDAFFVQTMQAVKLLIAFTISISILLIVCKNPIHSILLLIGLFFRGTIFLFTLQREYFSRLFLIVYVGAIVVLFLFIIRRLDLKSVNTKVFFKDLFAHRHGIVWLLVNVGFILISQNFFDINYIFFIKRSFNLSITRFIYDSNLFFDWASIIQRTSHISALGGVLYTEYKISIILVAFLLFISRMGSLTITLGLSKSKKINNIFFITENILIKQQDSNYQVRRNSSFNRNFLWIRPSINKVFWTQPRVIKIVGSIIEELTLDFFEYINFKIQYFWYCSNMKDCLFSIPLDDRIFICHFTFIFFYIGYLIYRYVTNPHFRQSYELMFNKTVWFVKAIFYGIILRIIEIFKLVKYIIKFKIYQYRITNSNYLYGIFPLWFSNAVSSTVNYFYGEPPRPVPRWMHENDDVESPRFYEPVQNISNAIVTTDPVSPSIVLGLDPSILADIREGTRRRFQNGWNSPRNYGMVNYLNEHFPSNNIIRYVCNIIEVSSNIYNNLSNNDKVQLIVKAIIKWQRGPSYDGGFRRPINNRLVPRVARMASHQRPPSNIVVSQPQQSIPPFEKPTIIINPNRVSLQEQLDFIDPREISTNFWHSILLYDTKRFAILEPKKDHYSCFQELVYFPHRGHFKRPRSSTKSLDPIPAWTHETLTSFCYENLKHEQDPGESLSPTVIKTIEYIVENNIHSYF